MFVNPSQDERYYIVRTNVDSSGNTRSLMAFVSGTAAIAEASMRFKGCSDILVWDDKEAIVLQEGF